MSTNLTAEIAAEFEAMTEAEYQSHYPKGFDDVRDALDEYMDARILHAGNWQTGEYRHVRLQATLKLASVMNDYVRWCMNDIVKRRKS